MNEIEKRFGIMDRKGSDHLIMPMIDIEKMPIYMEPSLTTHKHSRAHQDLDKILKNINNPDPGIRPSLSQQRKMYRIP